MRRKTLKALAALFILCILYMYIEVFSGFVLPWDKQESIQTTLEWGGLAPLPVKTSNVNIEKTGLIFTREFIIEFKATENQLKDWIKNSKRLKNNIPKLQGSRRIYDIHPDEEESFGGNVKVEDNSVTIKMSWS